MYLALLLVLLISTAAAADVLGSSLSTTNECKDADNCRSEWKEYCIGSEYSMYMLTNCPKMCKNCGQGNIFGSGDLKTLPVITPVGIIDRRHY